MRSIAVYCGSRDGRSENYRAAAIELGACIASRGWRLVYGGARSGMMGAIADTVLQGGGEVVGVMPHVLATKEITHTGLTDLHLVDDMHARKLKMMDLADAFVVFPGGAGTLEEFFEVYTWAQIGIHQKPIVFFNVDGFWDPLFKMLDHFVAEGFMDARFRHYCSVVQSGEELVTVLS
ncbi:MAG: TIGR00730 family Rossman fold protein [Bacilli bacterium]